MSEASTAYNLEVLDGKLAGRSYLLEGARAIALGRSPAAKLKLEDEGVARLHSLIVLDPTGVHVYDLHSRAGTLVNGKKVHKAALVPGDVLSVGPVRLRLAGLEGGRVKGAEDLATSSMEIATVDAPSAGVRACERCDRVLFEKELKSKHTSYLYGSIFCAACALILERQPEDLPGYKLLTQLGRGGMGEVHKAIDLKRERIVAIKQLHIAGAAQEQNLQYFAREVKLCRKLKSPHIVRIYSVAKHKDVTFFTMQYVAGDTIQRHVEKSGPLSPRTGAVMLHQIGQALEVARAQEIVHRDVKPANILMKRDGKMLLADFGLAKSLADAQMSGLSMSGDRLIGTPHFMAPEQVSSPKSVDHRADLFALGSVAYFALTGKRPFEGETLAECLFKVVKDEPKELEKVRPEIPKALGAIVRKLMAKRPEDRFQTGGELAEASVRLTRRG